MRLGIPYVNYSLIERLVSTAMLDQPSLQELVPDFQNGLAFQYAGWACHKLQVFSLVSCRKVSLVERQFCHLTATLCQWLSSSFKADSPPCHLQVAGGWIWAHCAMGLALHFLTYWIKTRKMGQGLVVSAHCALCVVSSPCSHPLCSIPYATQAPSAVFIPSSTP